MEVLGALEWSRLLGRGRVGQPWRLWKNRQSPTSVWQTTGGPSSSQTWGWVHHGLPHLVHPGGGEAGQVPGHQVLLATQQVRTRHHLQGAVLPGGVKWGKKGN